MLRAALILVFLLSLPAGTTRAQTVIEDYIDELIRLGELTDKKEYREAITVYKRLQAQPATPGWLKAASDYEMAELYGALNETDSAIVALSRAVQLGFDDCLTPRSAERLAGVLRDPRAAQVLAGMRIGEADFRELVWLKAEAQNTHHDARTMIIENTNRLDHQITEIPQIQLPTRPTTSAGVLYWRLQLLAVQKIQRDYVRRADLSRMKHVTTMAIISGGISTSAAIESARRAQAAAESRKAAIRSRTFVPLTKSVERVRPCFEWNRQ
jgi:hypothetical protein